MINSLWYEDPDSFRLKLTDNLCGTSALQTRIVYTIDKMDKMLGFWLMNNGSIWTDAVCIDSMTALVMTEDGDGDDEDEDENCVSECSSFVPYRWTCD